MNTTWRSVASAKTDQCLVFCFSILFLSGNLSWAQDFDSGAHDWLQEQSSFRLVHRRDSREMTDLVRPVAKAAGSSVVQVLCGDRTVALGTIVSEDGYVLTKRSELTGDPVRVRLADDRLLAARVSAVRRASDLALLRIESEQDFEPIQWANIAPKIGSFVISPGRAAKSIDFGVVGVHARAVAHQGKLGVELGNDTDGRARVNGVRPSSGAASAGIKRADRIIAINGRTESSSESAIQTLRTMFPGDSVRLTIERSGTTLEMDAPILDYRIMEESENDSKVNGPRSIRLSGFDLVLQHDTVLEPEECGGPLLDSSGRAIGLNIARAGRVVSYALPSSLVTAEMVGMLSESRAAR